MGSYHRSDEHKKGNRVHISKFLKKKYVEPRDDRTPHRTIWSALRDGNGGASPMVVQSIGSQQISRQSLRDTYQTDRNNDFDKNRKYDPVCLKQKYHMGNTDISKKLSQQPTLIN